MKRKYLCSFVSGCLLGLVISARDLLEHYDPEDRVLLESGPVQRVQRVGCWLGMHCSCVGYFLVHVGGFVHGIGLPRRASDPNI